MRFERVLICSFCVLFLAALAGCGTGGGYGGGGQSGAAEKSANATGQVVKTIEVKETEYKLDPANIDLDKAGTYVFKAVNAGNTPHALEIEGNGVEEETDTIDPGKSAELKVSLKAGKYEIYCPVDGHRDEGMEGTVTVAQGSGGGY